MESTLFWVFIIWLAIGAFAGWLAGRVMGSAPFGLFGNIFFGILGAVVGGWITSALGIFGGGIFWSFIVAFLGAVLVLWVIRLFKKV